MTVPQVLYHNTQRLVDYLRWELEIEENKLNERFHDKTLEQIFIENRIYKCIEDCTEEDAVYEAVFAGLEPFKERFRRDVTREDIDRLLRIPIRRISLFDINKNRKELDDILKALEEVRHHLAHLKDYAINFIKDLLKRYGKDYPRRTEISSIEVVDAKEIALANTKVGLDRKGGYIGTAVSGADSFKCTEFDRIVVLNRDGKFKVMNIPDKLFVGRFAEAFVVDKDQVYNVIYKETKTGLAYHKRCKIDKFILEKEYKLFPDKCKLELFETNYGIVLDCELEDTARSKDQAAELIFDDIPIRSASAKGFKTANRPITKFLKKKRGTEKPPEEEIEKNESELQEEEEEKTRRSMGWKSKTPIRFTAPEAIETTEEPVEEIKKSSKEMFLTTKANKSERQVPEPEPIKEETPVKKETTSEEREIPKPEPIKEEATVEEEAAIEETKEETPVEEAKDSDSQKTDVDDSKDTDEAKVDEDSSEKQATLDLPEESSVRRYLIDEDNPFKLEP